MDKVVSVIIPCFNQSKFAYEAVLSAVYAYSGPLEILIVNDGSTEPAVTRRLRDLSQQFSDSRVDVSVINQRNAGLSASRNAGIKRSSGKFIQLLDCDDLLVEGKIDRQVQHLEVVTDLDVSISSCLYANDSLDAFERNDSLIDGFDFSVSDFLFSWERGLSIPIHCALFRRSVFSRRLFDVNLRAKEDWAFWSLLSIDGCRIAYLPIRGAVYRIHDKSMCRSTKDVGEQWLAAARLIEPYAKQRYPEFLAAAMDWKWRNYDGLSTDVTWSQQVARKSSSCTTKDWWKDVGKRGRPSDLRLSVVIPVFNHFEFLGACFESLGGQNIENLEIVCWDDASTDPRVAELLKSAPENSMVRVFANSENIGIASTQNSAIRQCRGEYIAFLDCDDYLPPDALRRALNFIDQNGGCDYFFSDYIEVSSSGRPIRDVRYGGYSDDRFTGNLHIDLLNGMVASHLKVVNRSSIERVGGFDPKYSGVQDWELALKLLGNGKFLYLPEMLYCRRVHPETVTSGDVRGQFQLTNMLRKCFATKLLRGELSGHDVVLKPQQLGDVRTLSAIWKESRTILSIDEPLDPKLLWWIREFNSYFDEIIWRSPEVYGGLLGYMWSPGALRRAA